ncbi:MAG: transcriptional repressor [Lachnospiraceae bacterium]|nr:transcriptional repressor [Lachnospiraceae bacterium]
MPIRSKYKTKQKEVLLEYLKTNPGVHITAADVCACFKKNGTPISQATIYRHLEKLVDEGLINKYIIDAGSPACFEYVGAGSPPRAETCFHCKCEKCGRLIHLHCDELEEIQGHLLREHRFKIDPLRTVFYGLCEDCMSLPTEPVRKEE